jgi:hypothetical protein
MRMKRPKGDINFHTAILKRFTAVECLLQKAELDKYDDIEHAAAHLHGMIDAATTNSRSS